VGLVGRGSAGMWVGVPGANDWSPVTVALAGLGILTALVNTLSICGSKFWQKNWERHIEKLEDEQEGRL
jgi:hypothetical protein